MKKTLCLGLIACTIIATSGILHGLSPEQKIIRSSQEIYQKFENNIQNTYGYMSLENLEGLEYNIEQKLKKNSHISLKNREVFKLLLARIEREKGGMITKNLSSAPESNAQIGNDNIYDIRILGLKKTNEYRPEYPLVLSNSLNKIAQYHASNMCSETQKLSHIDQNGHNAYARIQDAGHEFQYYYGENIAHGFQDIEYTIDGWIKSPAHKKNMLNTHFKKMGIGYCENYWVALYTD